MKEKLKNSFSEDTEQCVGEKIFDTQENEILHNPYSHETRKLDAIRKGDIDQLIKCQYESWSGRIGKVADDFIRQEKNIGIIVIVLASRAAIEGGLAPELAFTMADAFILRLERMNDLLQIRESIFEYEVEFARCVKNLKTPVIQNKYVELTKSYVYKHLHTVIKVEQISKHIGLNRDYLSTLFHKCEGITLQEYIKREKIRQAEYMLKYSDDSISAIANYLAFSSQSHFSHSFKQVTGFTPIQYRNQHTKI